MKADMRMTRPALLGAVLAAAILPGPLLAAPAQQPPSLFQGFQTDSKDPVQIDAASLDISEQGQQRVAVFDGDVTVVRGDTTIKAGKMTVYTDIDNKNSDTEPFNRIEATGGVRVTSGSQVLTGGTAVVDMKSHTITMSGNVVLAQGDNVISGERLVVDTQTGRARIEQAPGKRIRGVFSTSGMKPPAASGGAK
jgi:lipopolysaccharide export system protein LptA